MFSTTCYNAPNKPLGLDWRVAWRDRHWRHSEIKCFRNSTHQDLLSFILNTSGRDLEGVILSFLASVGVSVHVL